MTNGAVRNDPTCRVIVAAEHSLWREGSRPGVGNYPNLVSRPKSAKAALVATTPSSVGDGIASDF
jgi:hypothetical protein